MLLMQKLCTDTWSIAQDYKNYNPRSLMDEVPMLLPALWCACPAAVTQWELNQWVKHLQWGLTIRFPAEAYTWYPFLSDKGVEKLGSLRPEFESREITCKPVIPESSSGGLKGSNTKRSNSSQGHFGLLACRHFETPPRNPVLFAAIKRLQCQSLGNGAIHPTLNI